MSRLIDADELMHTLLTAIEVGKRNNEPTYELVAVLNYVNCNAENSYFVPVVHGHWEYIGGYGYQYRCSNCIMCSGYKTSFCPHCGAKMDEVTI